MHIGNKCLNLIIINHPSPMKKVFFGAIALALLAASCNKKDTQNNLAKTTLSNAWLLGTVSYDADSVKAIGDTLRAFAPNSSNKNGAGTISFIFNGNVLPTV